MARLYSLRIIPLLAAIIFASVLAVGQTTSAQGQKPVPSEEKDDADLINADRPGIADGSTVVGAKRVQVETGFQEEFRRTDEAREHTLFFPTLLRIGISNRLEARVEGNSLTRTSDIEPGVATQHSSGLAPFSFGFKYQFEDSKGVSHPSLGTIVRVFPAWGTGDFRSHHVAADVRLAADWDFAPRLKLSLNPNVGVGRYEDGQGNTFVAGLFAVTLNYAPTKKLNPFVDLGLQSPEEKAGESSVIFDTGVAYIIGRNLQLDASIGAGAHGQTPPHPFVSVGVSFRSRNKRRGK
jgi:hypothetical protein